MRVGTGYDVHRLVEGRLLVLGGVSIDYELGLEGHSDADVLCHAVADALLGAAGENDIGHHFPNTSREWAGVSSLRILERVREILYSRYFEIGNVDATVISEAPKISPHLALMKERMSEALGILPDQIGIKATTNEGVGFLGRGEGIAAIASALLIVRS